MCLKYLESVRSPFYSHSLRRHKTKARRLFTLFRVRTCIRCATMARIPEAYNDPGGKNRLGETSDRGSSRGGDSGLLVWVVYSQGITAFEVYCFWHFLTTLPICEAAFSKLFIHYFLRPSDTPLAVNTKKSGEDGGYEGSFIYSSTYWLDLVYILVGLLKGLGRQQ